MNETILLYTVLAVICGLSVAFLAQAFVRRSKASPLEIGAYMACFVLLALFAVVFKQGMDIALDPGIAHPVGYNGGEGCKPDCLPATFQELSARLDIK